MNVNDDCIVKSDKFKMVVPDGGWGYMIWIAAVIIFSTTKMFLECFSTVYKDILEDLDMDSDNVTVLGGTCATCIAVAGYFTGSLLKVMSLRKLALLASFLYNLGAFCTVFVTSKLTLFVCLGPLQSSGFGILFNLICTQLNGYFKEKRLLSYSLTYTLSAASTMLVPQIATWSLNQYGYRGTRVLVSGLSLQIFIAVALMQPVSKHMKKVRIPGEGAEELKLLIADDKNKNGNPVTTPIITVKDLDCSVDSKTFSEKLENVELVQTTEENEEFRKILNKIIDLKLIKMFLLSAATLGSTYCLYAEWLFTTMLPHHFYSVGWNDARVALAVKLITLGDLLTRILLTLFNKWLKRVGNQEMYLIGLLIAVVTRLGMLWSHNMMIILIFITLMGVSRCTISVLPPLLLADLFPPERFTTVIGTHMLMMGIMQLTIGPALGAIRDVTENYATVIYIMTSFSSAFLLLWSIELLYKRNEHKRVLAMRTRRKLQRKRANKK